MMDAVIKPLRNVADAVAEGGTGKLFCPAGSGFVAVDAGDDLVEEEVDGEAG